MHLTFVGGLDLDFAAVQFKIGGRPVHLTATEVKVLFYLVRAYPNVASRDEILADSLSRNAQPNAVDAIISRLRQRLGDGCIRTERGAGYAWALEPDSLTDPHNILAPVAISLSRQPSENFTFPAWSPIVSLFAATNSASTEELLGRLDRASSRIVIFGLTRNFYAGGRGAAVIERKSRDVPVLLFIMDPSAPSRADRYRLEPTQAALEEPQRMRARVLAPLRAMLGRTSRGAVNGAPGLDVFLYNFPCSFGMELIDDVVRVMLYGHGKRGTDGPILTFRRGTQVFGYFESQLEWCLAGARGSASPAWDAADLRFTSLAQAELE